MTGPPGGASADVLVVGNGILGLALAAELLRRDPSLHVAVAGPPARAGGASRAAGAMLGCFGEVTNDTLSSAAGSARFELGLAAHRSWPAYLERLRELAARAEQPLHHVEGTHVVLNSCGGTLDSANFEAMLQALEKYGEPWREVPPADVPGLNPRPDARPLRAVHLPAEGAVDGNQVLRLLERGTVAAGVEYHHGEVRRLVTAASGAIAGAELADGRTVAAGTVVVAAGAFSGPLLDGVLPPHAVPPVLSGAGVAVVGRRVLGAPFETVVRSPNRSGSCGLHVVPLTGAQEYLGATNVLFAEPELHPYLGVGHFLVDCAMRQLDERIFLHRVAEWRVGNRPVPLDGFPLVGWAEGAPGLYVLTGTYRDGFHCAPALADHAAGEILGDAGAAPLPFPPVRAPLRTRTVEESVAAYVLHMTAGWFEARAGQPLHVTTQDLGATFRTEAEQLYDRLGCDHGLGPDVLMFLLASRKDPADVDRVAPYLRAVA